MALPAAQNEGDTGPQGQAGESTQTPAPSSDVLSALMDGADVARILQGDAGVTQAAGSGVPNNEPGPAADESAENGPNGEVEHPAEGQNGEDRDNTEEQTQFRGLLKRIDKLTAKYRAAEEELKSLRERQSGRSESPSSLGDVWTREDLERRRVEARNIKRWADRHPDGINLDGRDYSPEQIRQIKYAAEDALEESIPARERFLHQYNRARQQAVAVYPWWDNPEDEQRSMAEQVIREVPAIRSVPGYELAVGDYLRGRAARIAEMQQKQAQAIKPRASASPPKLQARPPSAIPARQAASDATRALDAALKSGNKLDLERYLAQV